MILSYINMILVIIMTMTSLSSYFVLFIVDRLEEKEIDSDKVKTQKRALLLLKVSGWVLLGITILLLVLFGAVNKLY